MIFRPVEAARTKLFLYKFALKGFFFCYLKEEQTPANLSTSVFSYFNISPFLLFSKLFYFLESQFRNLLHPFRSRLLVFPSHYSATAVVLFIDLWIDPPPTTSTSLLSFPLLFVFHAFPFAPIPVSSSFTAKSRRYSPLLASRDGFFLPSPVRENFYPPIDGPRPEFSTWKWREQADFRAATSLVFPSRV